MSASRSRSWVIAIACSAAAASAAVGGAWSAAGASASKSPAGEWTFRLTAQVIDVPEHNIGVLDLRPNGTCALRMRSNFNGVAHDHEAATCAWRAGDPTRQAIDGSITLTGVAEPGPTVVAFVLANGGDRLLLMLDDTAPAVVGTGEAFRR